MTSNEVTQSFTIHLGVNGGRLRRIEDEARSHDMSVIMLDLKGLSSQQSLIDYLARTFLFPHEVGSLDAVIDLISDLDWLGNACGYVVVARGANESPDVAEVFVSLLPNITDRWRAGRVPFVVAIDGKSDRLQKALFAANRKMHQAGELPWARPGTGAVDIIVH